MTILGMNRSKSPQGASDHTSVVQHLTELRRRVVKCVGFFLPACVVSYFAYGPVLHFLLDPLCQVAGSPGSHAPVGAAFRCQLYVTSPLDGLSLHVRLTVFSALCLSTPVFAYQLWRFVNPGLRRTEKRLALSFAAATTVLFTFGALTACEILPHALSFLGSIGGPNLTEIYNPISYLGLITVMMVIFGVAFEFPLVLVSLELARIVSSTQLLHWWRWAVMAIMVVAGIFVPSSDPLSMCALAVPLVVFYFLAIGVGRLLHR